MRRIGRLCAGGATLARCSSLGTLARGRSRLSICRDARPAPRRATRDRWGGTDRAVGVVCLDLGYGWCEDHNAPTGTGVSPYAMNRRDDARVSTNDGYLEPARTRANLRIVGDALIDRVEFT